MSTPNHWKRILVPTDFSESATKAIREVQCLQQLTGAEVVLLHATEPAFEGMRIHTRVFHDEIQVQAREQLESLIKESFPDGSPVSYQLCEGRAGEVICETARSIKADVIFIASHGITALKHYLLGSVAEKVVRHAPCSVLLVR